MKKLREHDSEEESEGRRTNPPPINLSYYIPPRLKRQYPPRDMDYYAPEYRIK